MIGVMLDTPRREALNARAQKLRDSAESLRAKVVDEGMKDLIRRLVIYPLDDVQGFSLGRRHVPDRRSRRLG
jgi:hypothetical protein